MRIIDFLEDKKSYIISAVISIMFVYGTMWTFQSTKLGLFICIIMFLGSMVPLVFDFFKRKKFYDRLIIGIDGLDQKNLLSEVVSSPDFYEGELTHEIIRTCNKDMLDKINEYKRLQEDYREYIEMWIHEIKTPIASSKLLLLNNENEATKSIMEEIDKVEGYIEQVLYYTRSSNVEKDYFIKGINLKSACFKTIKKNSRVFIKNNIKIDLKDVDQEIYTDIKWFEFILNQILCNSVKYMDKQQKSIILSGYESDNSITLKIKDNGCGIKKSEIARIFDKGFTGSNGRKNERSTGIGLYLCRKLCDKLSVGIYADSLLGEGTEIRLVFPKNSLIEL